MNSTTENQLKEIRRKTRKIQLATGIILFMAAALILVSTIILFIRALSLPDTLESKGIIVSLVWQNFLFTTVFAFLGASEVAKYMRDKYT